MRNALSNYAPLHSLAMKPFELVSALVARAGGSSKVARAMGKRVSQSTLHKICDGKVASPKADSAKAIADFFELPLEAIYDERVASRIWEERFHNGADLGSVPVVQEPLPKYEGPRLRLVAQNMSHLSPITLPSMTWEVLMNSAELPEVFILAAPDDALAPTVRAGDELIWSTTKPAKIGSPILVRDARGQIYVRRMYEGDRPGHFVARVRSDAYRALDSEGDGLQVLAVYAGRLGDFDD